ncbi:MAG: hypothetical protein A4E63_02234 [Syntrophorhabdus sp. PtaU1.Bin050]|nr:MAG: hypothetical protein A4E63_02234 [Syntrophorhabdus sp. PtaU1.Bin050]
MARIVTKRNILIALALVLLFGAINREHNLLYVMVSLLTSVLILAHLLPIYSLRCVSGGRSIQSAAFEGDVIDCHIRLANTGRGSRYMIEVVDSFPAGEPELRSPMTFITRLRGRQERNYSFPLTCYKRGEYVIGPLRLRSAYPLGISSISRTLPVPNPTLLVYPRVFEIPYIPLRANGYMPMLGVEVTSRAGGCEEFIGVREYKEGDSLKYIHWPSTAKHNRYIVKEFEIRASTEITIFLDLHSKSNIGKEKETTLEYAIKIAASIAKYALERGHSIQIVGYGAKPLVIPYGKGINHMARVLEELARAAADGDIPCYRVVNDYSGMMRDGGTAVLLLPHFDGGTDEYLYSYSLLKAKRTNVISVFFDADSFRDDPKNAGPGDHTFAEELVGQGETVFFVHRGDNLQEVFSG